MSSKNVPDRWLPKDLPQGPLPDACQRQDGEPIVQQTRIQSMSLRELIRAVDALTTEPGVEGQRDDP